jgi:hypothetical protein
MTEAFPLKWPDGWPRHRGSQESDKRFNGPTFRWDRVYRGLVDELKRLGATNITVSTNQPIRQDGAPYAQERRITDPGVAVYFTRRGKAMVMAQDRFWSIIGNMRSLTMAIEGLRQMERHGGATMMERAFDGFAALPPPDKPKRHWAIVLGYSIHPEDREDLSTEEVEIRFRNLAKKRHPDRGGTVDDMAELNDARAEALAELTT